MPKPDEIPVREVQFTSNMHIMCAGGRRETNSSIRAGQYGTTRIFLRHPFLVIQSDNAPEQCIPLFQIRYLLLETEK